MKAVPFLAFVLWSLAACSSVPREQMSLPDAMLGNWGWSEESCGSPDDDGRVEIERRAISFAVSRYDVQRIARTSPNSVRAEAIVHEEGYEQTERGSIELDLVENDRLHITAGLQDHTYVRCTR